jgi:hypothetical protein
MMAAASGSFTARSSGVSRLGGAGGTYAFPAPEEDEALASSCDALVVAWEPTASSAEARITTAPRRRDDVECAASR